MQPTTNETREVTCAYCREQFRVVRTAAPAHPFVVRCPHCTSVFALRSTPSVTKAKAAA